MCSQKMALTLATTRSGHWEKRRALLFQSARSTRASVTSPYYTRALPPFPCSPYLPSCKFSFFFYSVSASQICLKVATVSVVASQVEHSHTGAQFVKRGHKHLDARLIKSEWASVRERVLTGQAPAFRYKQTSRLVDFFHLNEALLAVVWTNDLRLYCIALSGIGAPLLGGSELICSWTSRCATTVRLTDYQIIYISKFAE